jgi:hypothetical protein
MVWLFLEALLELASASGFSFFPPLAVHFGSQALNPHPELKIKILLQMLFQFPFNWNLGPMFLLRIPRTLEPSAP